MKTNFAISFLFAVSIFSSFALATTKKSCESHLLSSFHLLVESAHRSGDITSEQIAETLKSHTPKNPMPLKGLNAQQFVIRKAIDRTLDAMTPQQWANTKASLQEFLKTMTAEGEKKEQASATTRAILNPQIIAKWDLYSDLVGVGWQESDPLKLAIFVEKPKKYKKTANSQAGIFVEYMPPFSPSHDQLVIERKMTKLDLDPETDSFVTANGIIDVVEDRSDAADLVRIHPNNKIDRFEMDINIISGDAINSTSVTYNSKGDPLVAVTTQLRIMIFSPLKSEQALVSLETRDLNSSSFWLKIAGEEPMLVINHLDGSSFIDPFSKPKLKFDFPYAVYPYRAQTIKAKDGQVYLATRAQDHRVLVFAMYDMGSDSKEKK